MAALVIDEMQPNPGAPIDAEPQKPLDASVKYQAAPPGYSMPAGQVLVQANPGLQPQWVQSQPMVQAGPMQYQPAGAQAGPYIVSTQPNQVLYNPNNVGYPPNLVVVAPPPPQGKAVSPPGGWALGKW